MTARLYLVPFRRTNPDASPDGSWRVMLEDASGKRHINHAPDLETAIKKAKRAAEKRGIDFERPSLRVPEQPDPEAPAKAPKPKGYMYVPRPQDCPEIGETIYEILPDNTKLGPLICTDYLASQFIAEDEAGKVRIIKQGTANWTNEI